jgi:hypothetical protein
MDWRSIFSIVAIVLFLASMLRGAPRRSFGCQL